MSVCACGLPRVDGDCAARCRAIREELRTAKRAASARMKTERASARIGISAPDAAAAEKRAIPKERRPWESQWTRRWAKGGRK